MIGEVTNAGTMFEQFLNEDIVHLDAHVDTLTHLLKRMKRLATAKDAKVVTVSLPDGVFDNRPLLNRLARLGYSVYPRLLEIDAPDALVQEADTRAGLPCYVVTEIFREHGDDPTLYFESDHQMTAKGHYLFARSIAPYVAADIRAEQHD